MATHYTQVTIKRNQVSVLDITVNRTNSVNAHNEFVPNLILDMTTKNEEHRHIITDKILWLGIGSDTAQFDLWNDLDELFDVTIHVYYIN